MPSKRRLKNWKPLIPGFWPMVATLLLLGAILGFYAVLGAVTTFEPNPRL